MTTETQAAPETGPMTLDQFTAALDAEQAAPTVEEEEEKPDPESAVAEGGDIEEPEAEEEVEALAEEEEIEPEPIPDPPQSWSKEDREAWAELTPKAREVVLRREVDRDKAITQMAQKTSEAVKFVQGLAAQTTEIQALATTEFERKWGRGEEGEIDWVKLANLSRQYPQDYDYQSTRAQFEAERTELKRVNKLAAEQSELAQRTFIAEQFQELEKIAPELADPKEGQARRMKVFSYLESQGIPREVFSGISAIELKIAAQAMRADEMDKKAKQAAAMPRKEPAKPAPKAIRPAGSGDASPQRSLQGLSQKLTNSGKLDDFVALMDAEEAQRARKRR